jgi:hypothetical protein
VSRTNAYWHNRSELLARAIYDRLLETGLRSSGLWGHSINRHRTSQLPAVLVSRPS